MTAAAIGEHAVPGSPQHLQLALTLAFLSGAMLLFLGVCLASLLLGIRLLPETRHMPLEAIESRVLAGLPLRELGHRVGHRAVERFVLDDGAPQRVVHLLRQKLLLFGVVEDYIFFTGDLF